VAGGELSGRHPGNGGFLPPITMVVGSALAIAVLVAFVPLLAGLRSGFDPWGPIRPMQTDGGPIVGVAFALLSTFGSGLGLVAIASVAVFALARTGRRFDAAFVAFAAFGAVILSQALRYDFHAVRPSAPESVAGSIGSADAIAAVAIAVAVGVALLTRWRGLVLVGLAIGLVAVALQALGSAILPVTAGFDAFPSGHAVYSMTLASSISPLVWRDARARRLILAASLLYIVGVGVSRVYLHAHLPPDVVAGWCVALAWTTGLRLLRVALARNPGATIVADDRK
jgi:membrane-associated phospholipid phosphatase